VNRELEKNARTWVASDDKDLRWLGSRAMVYFKSDHNANLLRPLLKDTATWERVETLHMTNLSHPHRPKHLTRWEAWHTLIGWGYEAPPVEF
ncbi:MAG: hypothetical protein AAF492_14570, partial [Verrucomicrobiota bacterium]